MSKRLYFFPNTILAPPANPVAVAVSATSVDVSADTVPNATSYGLYQRTGPSTFGSVALGLPTPGYTVTGLTTGVEKEYRWTAQGNGAPYTDSLFSDSAFVTPGAPSISGISPSSGAVGAAVTISGNNFTGATAVTFNGTAATFTVLSPTSINTSVPGGATTGTIAVVVSGVTAVSANPFTVTVVAPTGNTITMLTADFGLNLYDVLDVGGYRKRSALATATFETDATSAEFSIISPMAAANTDYQTDSIVSVYDAAGVFVGSMKPASVSGVQLLTVALPGSGLRRFSFVEGGNTVNGGDITDFRGTYVQQIRRLNGTAISKVAPVRKVNRVAGKGDSIFIGDGTTNNSRYAWTKRLRDMLPSDWEGPALGGWGATYAGARLSTSLQQQAEADAVVAFMAGATGHKVYIDADGTNAYGFSFDPLLDASYKAAVWDKIHAADPDIKIKCGTLLFRTNPNPNGIGKVPSDYSAAYAAEAASRSSFVEVVDCLPWLDINDFYQSVAGGQATDGLHPPDAAAQKIARKWYPYVTGQPLEPHLQIGETVQEDDARITYSNDHPAGSPRDWGRNDTPGPGTGAIFHSGALRFTNVVGAWADIPTDATQIQFNTYTEASSGVFELLCNGNVIATYTLYSLLLVNNVTITSPVVAPGANTFRMRKRDDDGTNIYLDEIRATDGTATPTPSITPPPSPGGTGEAVNWRDVAATLTATAGALEMVSPTPGGTLFKGLARGDKAIPASQPGGISFKIPIAGSDVFGVLATGANPIGYPDYKFAFYRLSDGQVFAYEGLTQTIIAPTSADNDTYQIALEMVSGALAVVYRINNTVVRTVVAPPAVAYYPAAALNAVGAKITNVQIFSDAALVTY